MHIHEIKKGKMQENDHDWFWIKSYIENPSDKQDFYKVIVVASHEYLTQKLGFNPNNLDGKEAIAKWLDKETEKVFEDFKLTPEKFTDSPIVKGFFTQTVGLSEFIENEA